jgi:hypothetical protein
VTSTKYNGAWKDSPSVSSLLDMKLITYTKANLPNLRRLFVEARTETEESAYSRNAVSDVYLNPLKGANNIQFYNIVLFMSSVAVFSLVAQRMSKVNP